MCDKATINGKEWPTILISSGNEVVQMLERMSRTPTWLVVDGGALHARSAVAIRARNYKKWGSRGVVSDACQPRCGTEKILQCVCDGSGAGQAGSDPTCKGIQCSRRSEVQRRYSRLIFLCNENCGGDGGSASGGLGRKLRSQGLDFSEGWGLTRRAKPRPWGRPVTRTQRKHHPY